MYLITIILYCQWHFYTALTTLIIGVFTSYAVWRYKYHGAPSVNDKDSSSRISFSWTTRKWSSMTTTQSFLLRSPELIHQHTGNWYLEARPVNESLESGPAFEVFLNVRKVSALRFLWDSYRPFKAKQSVETTFKISVLREKLRKDNHSCEDGGVGKSIEFVVGNVRLNYFKNIFGPFTVNKDIVNESISLDVPLTFMVNIFILGSDYCKLRSNESVITKESQESQNDDEGLIDKDEPASTNLRTDEEDPESAGPEEAADSDSPSDAEMELLRLRNTLREVLGRREFSDLKITVCARIFHAHKAVLAVRCPSIISNLSPDGNNVTLEGVDPDVFGVVLEFMYACEIEEDLLGLISGDLLRAAVQLRMEDLKTLAEKSLLKTLNLTNAAERVQVAYECDSTPIKEPILQFIVAHKKEISSPEWRSIRRCTYAKEILFDLLNSF